MATESPIYAALKPSVHGYTDRPFVYDGSIGGGSGSGGGAHLPAASDGAVRHARSYTVGDAWESDEKMEPYVITTDMLLRLKKGFETMNRKCKRAKKNGQSGNSGGGGSNGGSSVGGGSSGGPHERIRAIFNRRYMKLLQMVVKTNYRYNMRRFIVTPPITQTTHQYYSFLRYIFRLDGLAPEELQRERVKRNARGDVFGRTLVGRGRGGITGGETSGGRSGNRRRVGRGSCHVDNAALQAVWKDCNTVELVNKSIKDQTQGGKSFLKQVVLAGKHFNSCYGKVLPDPTLEPDEIGLPACLMESQFHGAEMNRVVAILKRDPVFSADAITLVMRIKRNPYPYITLPSEIITQKQLDFDGDNVTLYIVVSEDCFMESLMRISSKLAMYCYFSRTRLTFSQTNGFRISGLLREMDTRYGCDCDGRDGGLKNDDNDGGRAAELRRTLGATFEHCRATVHASARVSYQLSETLLSLAQQYPPFVAYGFVKAVRAASFGGVNEGRIYPIGPDPMEMALHIAESGSTGTRESVERMFSSAGGLDDLRLIPETIDYAKKFIEAKNTIKKQGHNAKKMDSAFQNVIVDHDLHIVMKVDQKTYDLGYAVDYIQRDWVFSDLTTSSILRGVVEDERPLLERSGALAGGLDGDGSGFGVAYWERTVEGLLAGRHKP